MTVNRLAQVCVVGTCFWLLVYWIHPLLFKGLALGALLFNAYMLWSLSREKRQSRQLQKAAAARLSTLRSLDSSIRAQASYAREAPLEVRTPPVRREPVRRRWHPQPMDKR